MQVLLLNKLIILRNTKLAEMNSLHHRIIYLDKEMRKLLSKYIIPLEENLVSLYLVVKKNSKHIRNKENSNQLLINTI
jgi:hypothetical protein